MKEKIYAIIIVFLSVAGAYSQTITVNLKAYLEGPYIGTTMSTSLNSGNYLPLTQPYNTTPWNYQGTESVVAIPNANVVDWVLVELRETAGDASTAYEGDSISSQAGFILKNGSIVTVDGISPMQFSLSVTYKLYAVVYHRNHLAVLSGGQLILNAGTYSWDYTIGADQAYGGGNTHKEISPGVWGLVASDGDASGQVNNNDKNDVWKPQSGSSGYKAGDFSMNGQVDNVDKNDLWKVNSGKSSQVPGPWSCGKSIADVRDGQIYTTVQIGTQCWLRENLNIGTMITGTSNQTNNGTIEKYCYDNNTANCDVYGGLYQWNEMMQYVTTPGVKGICPEGWHLPTDAEWCTLEQFVDPTITCNSTGYRGVDGGGKLKEAGIAHWMPPNTGATNSSGFTALPGGRSYTFGGFYCLTAFAYFWSSSEIVGDAWMRTIDYANAAIFRIGDDEGSSLSVRCVKDPDNQPPDSPSNPNPLNNSTNQQLNTQLSWTCTDPENDPLTYDVYFGISNPPALVSTGQTATSYNPGTLLYNTTYYWKIVAHDDHANTTEGPVWMFTTLAPPAWTCGDLFTDPRDNQEYTTVQIGTQCWMAENLNIGTMIAGNTSQTNNGQIEKYCYDDNDANCAVYGGLFQWPEMMQYSTIPGSQGICPVGWHIPTDDQWETIVNFLGGFLVAGGAMKEAGTSHWSPPNTGATNSSGYTGLPGGWRFPDPGSFGPISLVGRFWSSTEQGSFPWFRSLSYYDAEVQRGDLVEDYGFSVRCLKD